MAITPYLLYEDVSGALKFLTKAFGFRKYGAQMSGPGGKINHAAMKLGDEVIMMWCPRARLSQPEPTRCSHSTSLRQCGGCG